MKKTFLCAAAVALALSPLACDDKKGTPGGPGAKSTPSPGGTGTVQDDKNNTFTIGTPTPYHSIKQGTQEVANFEIQRGSSFKDDVTISFEKGPEGITFEPSTHTVKGSDDKKFQIKIGATDKAALADHKITIV